jgi:hypothetical protein
LDGRKKSPVGFVHCQLIRRGDSTMSVHGGLAMQRSGRLFGMAWLAACMLVPQPACAWGSKGHEIIAVIATHRLSPHTAAAVRDILANDPDATGTSLSAVANWADVVRSSTMPETYNWHFVDIPVDGRPEHYEAARDCPMNPDKGDCVVGALAREVPKLSDPTATPTQRARALKFITHLIGDLHQPLHVAERRHDNGGNDVEVVFLDAVTDPDSNKRWTLHAVWDKGIIDETGRSPAAYVKRLEDWIDTQDAGRIASGTVVDWVNATHLEAETHAYRTASGTKPFPANGGRIGADYCAANRPVVDRQLAIAGVRLAKVLNDAFP